MNSVDIANYLKDLVIKASKIVRDNYVINNKGTYDDLVTNIDYEIEKFIIDELKKNIQILILLVKNITQLIV